MVKIFKDAYKYVVSTGVKNFFATIYIALDCAVSSLISFAMRFNSNYANKFNYHGCSISVNLQIR